MYPHIKKEVDEGKVLLEWDKSKGQAPVPLIKDKYAAERRKAKTMNFSLAYGKSAHGFAKDWNCSIKEATDVLNSWYNERKEVKEWQENVKRTALERYIIYKIIKKIFYRGWTKTLMGRYRNLTKYFKGRNNMWAQHGLRASINTPIQGGAADIVIAAMIKIQRNKDLKDMGWKLLLQIHDELILEGPEDSAKEALAIVKDIMRNPLEQKLRVELEVDAKIGNTWYESK